MEYYECLVQVDEVLRYLSEDNLKKIPEEIIKAIRKQKSKQYVWNYDESKELKDQDLDRNTIAILSYLNIEYLLNDRQKEYVRRQHELNEREVEEEKRKKYNLDEIFKNRNKKVENKFVEQNKENNLVVIRKDRWYEKINNFIKSFFKKGI